MEFKITDRLIVAADFKPTKAEGRKGALAKFYKLLRSLEGMGVIIKANSILRAFGYELITTVHNSGLKMFADLKLNDIPNTLEFDGAFLHEFRPDLLTVMCSTGEEGMRVLMKELPDTEILGVTVFTSMRESESQALFTCSTQEAVLRLAKMAQEAPIQGLICSPAEVEMLRKNLELVMTINTPAIRPSWSIVPGDDQNPERIMTPFKAIKAGADRIVVGRPILQADNPHDAAQRTLDEIAAAVA